jgi:hypothetical protein
MNSRLVLLAHLRHDEKTKKTKIFYLIKRTKKSIKFMSPAFASFKTKLSIFETGIKVVFFEPGPPKHGVGRKPDSCVFDDYVVNCNCEKSYAFIK